jgi:predicted ABC-class ATPase
MEDYIPHDLTEKARLIADRYRAERKNEGGDLFGEITERIPMPASINPARGRKAVNIRVHDLKTISFGSETIDLGAVEQLVDRSQTRAIADAILYAQRNYMDEQRSLEKVLGLVMRDIQKNGLDVLSPFPTGDYAEFRAIELAAALNRLRSLEVRHS